jgi:hypothetical protein
MPFHQIQSFMKKTQREPDGTYSFQPVVVEEGVCISLGGSFVKATVVERTSEEQLARPLVFRVKVDDATATQDVQLSDHWRPLVIRGDVSPPTVPAPTSKSQFASSADKPRWAVRVYGNAQYSMWLYYATLRADGAEVWWAARFQQGDLVSAPKGLFNDWPEEVLQKARALCVAARDQHKGLLRKEKESAAALAKMADDSAGSQLPPPPGARIFVRVRPDVTAAMSADMPADNMSDDKGEAAVECVKKMRATRSRAPVDISASVTFAQGEPPVWETTPPQQKSVLWWPVGMTQNQAEEMHQGPLTRRMVSTPLFFPGALDAPQVGTPLVGRFDPLPLLVWVPTHSTPSARGSTACRSI